MVYADVKAASNQKGNIFCGRSALDTAEIECSHTSENADAYSGVFDLIVLNMVISLMFERVYNHQTCLLQPVKWKSVVDTDAGVTIWTVVSPRKWIHLDNILWVCDIQS